MMNPLSTGWLMKLARNPSRSRPASSAATPAMSASAAVNAAKLVVPGRDEVRDRGRRQRRGRRHRPDDEHPRAAQRGVEHERARRRVEADDRRHARDARVGERLRARGSPTRVRPAIRSPRSHRPFVAAERGKQARHPGCRAGASRSDPRSHEGLRPQTQWLRQLGRIHPVASTFGHRSEDTLPSVGRPVITRSGEPASRLGTRLSVGALAGLEGSPPMQAADHARPSRMARLLPIADWLPRYDRSALRGDVLAGIAVAAMIVPKDLGYAGIAGIPVQNGLYAAAAGAIVYALFCTSRHISTGPSSSLAAVAGGAVLVAGVEGPQAAELVAAITLVTGALFLLLAVLRLGWIARFLSRAVVTGFLAGAAVDVVIGELPKLTGTARRARRVGRAGVVDPSLGDVTGRRVLVGLVALAVILGLRFSPRGCRARSCSSSGGCSRHRCSISTHTVSRSSATCPAACPRRSCRTSTSSRSTTRRSSRPRPGAPDRLLADRRRCPGVRGPAPLPRRRRSGVRRAGHGQRSRRVVPGDAGLDEPVRQLAQRVGRRPHAARVAGHRRARALTLIALAPLFSDLPKAVLGAIIIDAVVFGMIDIPELRRLRRVKPFDFWVAVTAIVAVLSAGVLAGVVIGIALSLVWLVYVMTTPQMPLLGRSREPTSSATRRHPATRRSRATRSTSGRRPLLRHRRRGRGAHPCARAGCRPASTRRGAGHGERGLRRLPGRGDAHGDPRLRRQRRRPAQPRPRDARRGKVLGETASWIASAETGSTELPPRRRRAARRRPPALVTESADRRAEAEPVGDPPVPQAAVAHRERVATQRAAVQGVNGSISVPLGTRLPHSAPSGAAVRTARRAGTRAPRGCGGRRPRPPEDRAC